MASVTPRRNRDGQVVWRVQFRIDGRMSQETFLEDRSAREFGALVDRVGGKAARIVLERRQNAPADMPTLREFLTRYLDPDSGLLTGIEPGTREGYRRAAERSFLPILGEYPIDAIDKDDVGRWLAWQEQQPSSARKGQKVAPKTIRNYHGILSSTLSAAVERKLRPDNPAYRTRLTDGVKREPVFLTPEEFATLLYFTPNRYQRFVQFLAGTGCRWGEATALTWGDLNLTAKPPTARITRAWKKSATGAPILAQPKSKKGRRTISLYPDLVDALGTPGAADALVFPGPLSGKHMWPGRFRSSAWVPAVKAAMDAGLCAREGLTPLRNRPTVHDLRHAHASWLIAAGVPLPYVQVRLGHEDITTTVGVYGHLVPDAHAQMADVVASTLGGVRTLREVAA